MIATCSLSILIPVERKDYDISDAFSPSTSPHQQPNVSQIFQSLYHLSDRHSAHQLIAVVFPTGTTLPHDRAPGPNLSFARGPSSVQGSHRRRSQPTRLEDSADNDGSHRSAVCFSSSYVDSEGTVSWQSSLSEEENKETR